MRSITNTRSGLGIAGLLTGLALGFAVSRTVAPSANEHRNDARRGPVGVPQAELAAARAAATNEALERIELRLAGLEQAFQRFDRPDRTPLTDPTGDGNGEADTLSRLEELIERVGALEAALVAEERRSTLLVAELTGLGTLKEQHPDIDWPALRELIGRWRLDRSGTERSVQLLSDRDLVRRYGSPTIVWSNDKGLHWFYRDEDPVTNAFTVEVYFRLQNGYVTTMGVAPE